MKLIKNKNIFAISGGSHALLHPLNQKPFTINCPDVSQQCLDSFVKFLGESSASITPTLNSCGGMDGLADLLSCFDAHKDLMI